MLETDKSAKPGTVPVLMELVDLVGEPDVESKT